MVKIQVDLSEEEDKVVEVYKLAHNLPTKEKSIKMMIISFKDSVGALIAELFEQKDKTIVDHKKNPKV